MLNTGRKAQVKQYKQIWVGSDLADLAERCRLMERKCLGLTMADVMQLAYLLALRISIKSLFCKRNEETERKLLKNFLRRHQEISVTTTEGVHPQERGTSLLNQ